MTRRRIEPRLAAALWIGLIYATVPFVRSVRDAFVARWPAELIAYAVITVVLGCTAAAIVILRRSRPHLGGADLFWLVGVTAIIVMWTRNLMDQPEETVHFIEYGVLGVLLYRVFDDLLPDPTVYVAATLTGLFVGTVDELVQWFVPGRFWDLRDIILNTGAVALVQIPIWRLHQRRSRAVSRYSIRLVCRLAAAQVFLFTLCMASTPQRLHRIGEHLPLPNRLTNGVDVICEYGFLHSVDDWTRFRSRLSPDDLIRSDRERAPDIARNFEESRGGGGISQSGISPIHDPFGYEFRIHLFARNRNLQKARAREPGSFGHRRYMTTAWRENLILENSFSKTLELSNLRWGPRITREAQEAQYPDEPFVSQAGAHLITRISEGRLRALLLSLFGALVLCDVLGATRSRPESGPE
jgi:hypothetical protein